MITFVCSQQTNLFNCSCNTIEYVIIENFIFELREEGPHVMMRELDVLFRHAVMYILYGNVCSIVM